MYMNGYEAVTQRPTYKVLDICIFAHVFGELRSSAFGSVVVDHINETNK